MKELNDIVAAKIQTMISDGSIQRMIEEKLESTVKESIDSALRSYGEFGKTITQKIEASILCGSRDIELPAYNKCSFRFTSLKLKEVIRIT